MWSLYIALLVLVVCYRLPTLATAFPIDYTVSQQCTPLNVTWRARANDFPYTVWILANHGFVQTYQIDSDYQPGSDYITFQYVVPPPSAGFTSYTVSVGNSNGDGNTTQALGIATPPGSSSNCPAYTGSAAFTYAADPKNGTMVQCGAVNFYNIGTRGTKPFTISFVPLGGPARSIQVPDMYTLNLSNFNYLTLVPFPQGTQFQTVLGDASGPGSGGASEIYTVGPSTLTPACLAEGYRLPNQLSNPLPIPSQVATFSNLPGAISTSAPATSGASKSTGAIAGGVIGGAIALGVAIGCLIAFLLYRKRQKTKRDLARREEVRFVDLDGDEDEWAAVDPDGRPRHHADQGAGHGGSTYSVSPFVYEPRQQQTRSSDGRYVQSLEMTSPSSTNPSYGDLLSAAGLSSAGVSPVDDYPPRAGNASMHSQSSSNPFSSRGAGFEHDADAAFASGSTAVLHSAGNLSGKVQEAANQARRDARAQRRVVQHTDGGSLPQPSSDTEDEEVVDELPPEYGGWLQNGPNAASGSANPSASASCSTPLPQPPASGGGAYHHLANTSISSQQSPY